MPDVTFDLRRALYMRIVDRVRGTDYSMNNILVEACRRLVGEPHPGRAGGRGQRPETQPGGPACIPEGDLVPFHGNVGSGTLREVRAHAYGMGLSEHDAIVQALERLLGV